MCKASLWAKHHEMAKDGVTYGIGISDHGLPALHPVAVSAKECIACVPDGKVLTLSNVPVGLQKKHGIGPIATVTFVDTGDNAADMLKIAGAKLVPLAQFAGKGIRAYVGVSPDLVIDELEPSVTIEKSEPRSVLGRLMHGIVPRRLARAD